MSIYYYLLNTTKKEMVHYDSLVKIHLILTDKRVHKALIKYMYDNEGDDLMFTSDTFIGRNIFETYKEIDLKRNNQ